MRYLIVNGDDWGMTNGVTRGILDAHRRGILTSASLMVNRPAAAAAAALAREAPKLSVGLHLELEGPADCETSAAVEKQLDRFAHLMDLPPTHLDSHRDVHRDPHTLPHVLRWAERFGIPVRSRSPVACFGRFYGAWGGESHPEQVGVESLLGILETEVQRGVTELICHPGYVDPELDSSYTAMREAELDTLCDPRVREAVDRSGIHLVGFRDLPELLPGTPEGKARPA
jgi:predicted glycoside hydrolase/deacetylase ChbG (UPF0249 family)